MSIVFYLLILRQVAGKALAACTTFFNLPVMIKP